MKELGSLSDAWNHTTHNATTTSTYELFQTDANEDVGLKVEDDTFMSTTTMNLIENVVQVGILPPLVLTGVTFNVINMAVFLRQGLFDRINLCIFSLAVCDTGYMSFNLVWRVYRILYLINENLGIYWKMRGLFMVSVYVGFMNTSNCLTLLISLERCFCVVWPLKVKTILSVRKMLFLIFLAVIICIPTSVINCCDFDVQSFADPVSNVTRYRLVPSTFYKRHTHIYGSISHNITIYVPIISLIAVMINTAIIAVHMRLVLAWRQKASNVGTAIVSSKERREASLTRMLVVVCVIYTVCTIPGVSQAFVRFTVPGFTVNGRYRNTLHATHSLMHVFLCINGTMNFIVYYTMSTKFKDTLRKLCKRRETGTKGEDKEGTTRFTTADSVKDTSVVSYSAP